MWTQLLRAVWPSMNFNQPLLWEDFTTQSTFGNIQSYFFSFLETGAGGMSSRNWGLASCTAQQNSHQEYLVPNVSSASSNIPNAHCFLSLPLLPLSSTEQSALESHFSQGTQNLVGETTTHWNNNHSVRLDGRPGDKLWSERTLGSKVFSTWTSSGLNGELQHWPCSTSYCCDCCQSAAITAAIRSMGQGSQSDGRLKGQGSRRIYGSCNKLLRRSTIPPLIVLGHQIVRGVLTEILSLQIPNECPITQF